MSNRRDGAPQQQVDRLPVEDWCRTARSSPTCPSLQSLGPPGDTCAVNAVEAVLVAEVRIGPVSRVRPLAGQRWLVQRALGELVVLDERLTPSWRLELPTGRPGIVAVADDLSLVAVSRAGQLVLLDGSGRQLASVLATPSGSSAGIFTADGAYLWVVLPGLGSETPTPASQEVWLLDVATRSLLDRCRVGLFVDDRPPIRHPDGRTVGLSLWVDGRAAIGWAVAERGRIVLRLCPWRDFVLADVRPAGSEYLTVSRTQGLVRAQPGVYGREDVLLRLRLGDDRPVGALVVSAATHGDDVWDPQSGYLANDLIVAGTVDTGRHLLVGTAPMGLLAEVVNPSPIGGSVPIPSGQGTWLTVGGGRVQHWMLPPLPGEQLQLPLT